MQLGSHYPSGDYFPLKDAYLVDQDGGTGTIKGWAIDYSGSDWPQYTYTSLPFREKLATDFAAYVAAFRGNHNIAGVILHNEPGLHWNTSRIFDYNPTTIAAFRAWLERRHGTITTLNRRWEASYASFAAVVPPGKPPVREVGAWMDWRRFNAIAVADFLRWEAGLFKTWRSDIPRTTNLDGPLNNWYGYRLGGDAYAYSAMMDRVGIDIYPEAWSGRGFVPYTMDLMQGTARGRDVHVLEANSFSPKKWATISERQRADLLRSEMWTMLGHGAGAVLLWSFTDGSGDYALTDGAYNARLRACREAAYAARMVGIDGLRRPRARVAVCIDPDSYIYGAAIEKTPLSQGGALDSEHQGCYTALREAGYQVDVIQLPQLRAGAAGGYAAIVLPAAVMMDAELAATLEAYVRGGGVLIADAPLATMDRWARPQSHVPAFGLDRVFGAMVLAAGTSPRADAGITTRAGAIPVLQPVVGLALHGATVLGTFRDGSPAITLHRYGKGSAVLIGGRAGEPHYGNDPGPLPVLLRDVLRTRVSTAADVHASARLDVSSLADARGNTLVVCAVQPVRGRFPTAARGVRIIYHRAEPQQVRAAFAFPPTTVANGMVRSGPVAVAAAPTADRGGIPLSPGDVTSALPVLLARNAGPLLALESPAAATVGRRVVMRVTCYNPSPTLLRGHLRLRSSSAVSSPETPVMVRPFGRTTVTLAFTPRAAVTRAVIGVDLVRTAPAAPVAAIPVDVAIGAETSSQTGSSRP